jgi:hypothetical protein
MIKRQQETTARSSAPALAPLERYIENAPELARKVVSCWADVSGSGISGTVIEALRGLLDKALRYQEAARHVDNRQEFTMVSDNDLSEAEQTRLAFAQEYKRLDDLTGSADQLLVPTQDRQVRTSQK